MWTFEDTDGLRYRLIHDYHHETRGSYGYDAEKSKAAEDHEIDMLSRGLWVALGCIVESKCETCDQWEEVDSLWGIVVADKTETIQEFVECNFDVKLTLVD